MKKEQGFTLIEMMIVLLVISVLLIITVPNITKHNSNINTKGCQAYIKMVEAQVQAFQIDKKRLPASIDELKTEGYLRDGSASCPGGNNISISATGEVTSEGSP
ncbi:competence type IV pilus major pilin ComGC [Mesobacillus zeae]|uniref:ComG operon protein 3 n=1 Tax=Mesobacillus zeae TaxID=1917180 RepID=A0A398B393_9BACI|nr:competence type IV pilus major pilin ComGC [Mesobacillus zeae]RID83864.1 prepilin-type N-terminal cleavage/methylation domain-containing protein [Mesobacillus zeae]